MSNKKASGRAAPLAQNAAISSDDLCYLRAGAELLDKADWLLRVAAALFEHDGTPTGKAQDLHYIVKEALDATAKASWELFSCAPDSAAYQMGESILDPRLWDAIDVLTLVCYSLQDGQYPPSNGVTCSPPRGGISVVQRTLPALRTRLGRFIDRVKVQPENRPKAKKREVVLEVRP